MTTYTTPHNLPQLETTDLIKSPTGDNLRKQINALSTASNTALDAVKTAAANDAITDATTKYGGLPDRVTSLEGSKWDKGVFAADLNTAQSSGRWAVNATNLANQPVALAGSLLVNWGSTTGTQEYVTRETTPRAFRRNYSAGAWGAWSEPVALAKTYTDSAKWDKGIWSADLNTGQTSGRWAVNATNLANQPAALAGSLTVLWNTTTGVQQYVTREAIPRVFYRHYTGTAWGAWVHSNWDNSSNFAAGYDWNLIAEPGAYPIWSATNNPTDPAETWTLYVGRTPSAGNVLQVAYSWTNPGKMAIRRRNAGAWGAWNVSFPTADNAKTLTDAKAYTDQQISNIQAPDSAAADIGIHQHTARLSHLRGRIGAPRMGGKAAVTIIMDHGTNKFASIVLPALQARGLRCTLALNSQMYSPEYATTANENQTTWAQIKGWHDNSGIEIANHGRLHQDATGEAAIRLEIEGGREELETNLPGVPIDTFVQIGTSGTGTKWDGFNDAITLDRYWETFAGRVILDSHALATGQVPHGRTPNRVYPLDGHPKLGSSGYWLDGGQAGIDIAKTKIDEAVAAGGGVILRLHPYVIDWTNQISTQQLTDFFNYLQGRVTAGEINVLPYREWSLAVGW